LGENGEMELVDKSVAVEPSIRRTWFVGGMIRLIRREKKEEPEEDQDSRTSKTKRRRVRKVNG
jgi:hypothetical protein